MAGALTHILVSIGGFLLSWFFFKKYYYGFFFALGNLAPDLIDFGIIGIFTGSLNPGKIMLSPYFNFFFKLGHTPWHWAVFGIIVFLGIFALYKFKKISRENFFKLNLMLILLLTGVVVHFILDATIIEKNYWI